MSSQARADTSARRARGWSWRGIATVFASAVVLVGCDVDIKIRFPASSQKNGRDWQAYATNKRTSKPEFWWVWEADRDSCVRNVTYQTQRGVQAEWYQAPAGCLYAGSDNRFVLYLVNRWLAPEALLCVAKWKQPGNDGRQYTLVLKGYESETDGYYCVLGN